VESELPQPPCVYRATEDRLEVLAVESSFKGPVLVDFWAAWVACHGDRLSC
jgi:thioredoxin-like negative regulator of GroEL